MTLRRIGAILLGQVNVLTRRPQDWAAALTISTEGSSWESKGTFSGKLNKVRVHDPCKGLGRMTQHGVVSVYLRCDGKSAELKCVYIWNGVAAPHRPA